MTDNTDRPEVDDPRVLALAKARQQIAYESPFNFVCPPWDGLSEQERHLSLLDARSYLHAALKAGLAAVVVRVPVTSQTADRDRAALVALGADAIRAAACPGSDCPHTEEECAEQLIQPAAWERGVLSEVYGRPEWFADAVLAAMPAPAAPTAVLTDAERTMLTYALDQAQEHIWSRDDFTDEDQAAVTSLRRMAAVPAAEPGPVDPSDDDHSCAESGCSGWSTAEARPAASSSSPELAGPEFKENAGNLNSAAEAHDGDTQDDEGEKLATARRMAKAMSAPPVAPEQWAATTEWPTRHKRSADRRVHATAPFVVYSRQHIWTACGKHVGPGGYPLNHMPVDCRGCKQALAADASAAVLPVGSAEPKGANGERERQRADQAEELLQIAHETSNKSEAERARAVAAVARVRSLQERWLKAGPPPIGTSMARWWDARLIELQDAIRPADDLTTET